MIGAKKGAPLAIGCGDGEMYLGSDALALSSFAQTISYLDDNEIVVLSKDGYSVINSFGKKIEKIFKELPFLDDNDGKGNFEHYMLKEINEQPMVLAKLLTHYFNAETRKLNFNNLKIDFNKLERIYIVACGTSYNAAMVAKYWFEKTANIAVEVEIASEYRYRSTVFAKNSLALFISQSGETADTLAALNHTSKFIETVAIVNVLESSITNAANYVLPLNAGFEISVASTKGFTAQLLLLSMLCVHIAEQRGLMPLHEYSEFVNELHRLPDVLTEVLNLNINIKQLAGEISATKSMLYIGRGVSYPLAIEGALKIKELAYIHAEGLAAGELKHGPIALIDKNLPIVVIAPHDELFSKTCSNIHEIYSRSGKIIVFTDKLGKEEIEGISFASLELPAGSAFTNPIIYTIPLQLLSYYTANHLGKDVDQPRNLAKSVTVE